MMSSLYEKFDFNANDSFSSIAGMGEEVAVGHGNDFSKPILAKEYVTSDYLKCSGPLVVEPFDLARRPSVPPRCVLPSYRKRKTSNEIQQMTSEDFSKMKKARDARHSAAYVKRGKEKEKELVEKIQYLEKKLQKRQNDNEFLQFRLEIGDEKMEMLRSQVETPMSADIIQFRNVMETTILQLQAKLEVIAKNRRDGIGLRTTNSAQKSRASAKLRVAKMELKAVNLEKEIDFEKKIKLHLLAEYDKQRFFNTHNEPQQNDMFGSNNDEEHWSSQDENSGPTCTRIETFRSPDRGFDEDQLFYEASWPEEPDGGTNLDEYQFNPLSTAREACNNQGTPMGIPLENFVTRSNVSISNTSIRSKTSLPPTRLDGNWEQFEWSNDGGTNFEEHQFNSQGTPLGIPPRNSVTRSSLPPASIPDNCEQFKWNNETEHRPATPVACDELYSSTEMMMMMNSESSWNSQSEQSELPDDWIVIEDDFNNN